MHNLLLNKIFKQRTILLLAVALFTFFLPETSSANMLLPGNITTCGELAVGGTYTLLNNVSSTGTSSCFSISSDNVTLDGGGFTITGVGTTSGATAIDARARVSGPDSSLTMGSNGYTNLIVSNINITGFTTGINTSGNGDTTGTGTKLGYGGDAGDVSIYYAVVGSVTSSGGNSTTYPYGGTGGNVFFTDTNLDISNSTFSLSGGVGTTGRNMDGGLDLNYSGTLTRTNVSFSSLSFLNDNATSYTLYSGGTWPITSTSVSSCGTLYSATTTTFTLTQNVISLSLIHI